MSASTKHDGGGGVFSIILTGLLVVTLLAMQPLPAQILTADAGPDLEVDTGTPVQIGGSPTASGGAPPYTYSWSPAEGLDDPTAANPVATPNTDITYRVTVTDAEGVQAEDEVTLRVRVWLYAISDTPPNQLTRVNIYSQSPTLNIVADEITYGGPAMAGLPPVGSVLNETEAAAIDPVNERAFIISNMGTTSALLLLDLQTGVATGIGFTGATDINALAFNPTSQMLYGLSSHQSQLYVIDTATGAATALPMPVTTTGANIEGLAFDHFLQPPVLYAVDEFDGTVYTIDVNTGEGTVAGVTQTGFESIEFSSDGTMFAAHNLSKLYTIDRDSSYAATVFANSLTIDGEGLLLNDGLSTLDDLIPVELAAFYAQTGEAEVRLFWVTATESENLGFNVYRSEQGVNDFVRVNSALIEGAGNSSSEISYEWADRQVEPGKSYDYLLEDVDFQGRRTRHGPVSVAVAALPSEIMLLQSYPNPFSVTGNNGAGGMGRTHIAFALARESFVSLKIFSITGREVAVLARRSYPPGRFTISWDGRDQAGNIVAGGVYFYSVQTPAGVLLKKKLLILK